MKILFIHDYPFKEGGGIETQTYLDALYLNKRGHNVTIASTRKISETYNKKINISKLNNTVKMVYITSKIELEKIIIENDIVSVQATFSLRNGMMDALKILNKYKKRHIISLRTTFKHIPFSRISNLKNKQKIIDDFSKYLKSRFCYIQTVSNSFDETLKFLKIKKTYKVIYNGKDWKNFTKIRNKNVSFVDITYIGEMSWMKGIHILLNIIPDLLRENPGIKFRIIGSGQNKNEFVNILKNTLTKNEHKRAEILDYIENKNIYSYICKTKIVFIPSLMESLCNVAIESLGSGTYVVGQSVEGLKEVIEKSKNGFLFKLNNTTKMLYIIKKVLKKEKARPDIKIQKVFSIERKINNLEYFYRKVDE
jgi:glycosyltransferase involved in cell wall biosynthesis